MNSLITMAPLLLNTQTADMDFIPKVQINNVYNDEYFKEKLYSHVIPVSIYKQPSFYKELVESVVNQFLQELKLKIDIFGKYNAEIVIYNFSKTVASLILLNPSKIGLELTSQGSIFIVSEIESKNIYIELFFNNELNIDVEAVLNIYENKKQLLSINGTISDIINELNESLNRKPNCYYYNPSLTYDLSNNPSTC